MTRLPPPGTDARAHSQRLVRRIREEIETGGGAIGFDRFMALALYEPGLGYYSAGARKFGAGGDFTTAPEVSSLFSRCLAAQCAEILHDTGGEVVMEMGAGSGVMACDVLDALSGEYGWNGEYRILEPGADLRARQQALISERGPRGAAQVRWLDGLPAEPFRGVILANEVVDAMPVNRVVIRGDRIGEQQVVIDGDALAFRESAPSAALDRQVRSLLRFPDHGLADGYTTEINVMLPAWVASLSGVLAAGALLLTDYGYSRHEYYHAERSAGTLLCHYRHRAHHDPFFFPGLQDITASVDFTALAEAGCAAGLDVAGYTTQAHFLIGCGLEAAIASCFDADPGSGLAAAREAKLLTLPGEMGERFKAMALGRGLSSPLRGFRVVDHRRRL